MYFDRKITFTEIFTNRGLPSEALTPQEAIVFDV
jgi:hypothetical protein